MIVFITIITKNETQAMSINTNLFKKIFKS